MLVSVDRPRATLALGLLLLLLAGFGASRLSINADNRILFSHTNENRQALDLFEKRYSTQTNLIIALHADDGDVFTPDRLTKLIELTDAAWRLPYATRVDSIVNATKITSDAEGLVVGDMVDAGAFKASPEPIAAEAREAVLGDRLIVNRLVADDGATTAINIVFNYPMGASGAAGEIVSAARAMVDDAEIDAVGLVDWQGGRVASSAAFSNAAKTDMKTLTPLAYVVIFVLVGILLRSGGGALCLLAPILFATIAAMGLAGWAGMSINAATASAPTVILTLGVATLIHLLTNFQARYAEHRDKSRAVKEALRESRTPIALALSTTAMGFATLNFADSPPFRDIGNITAAGALLSLIFGLTVLPALLTLAPLRPIEGGLPMQGVVNNATNFILHKRKACLITAPLVFAPLIAGVALIEIDDNFIRFFDTRYEFRRDAEAIQENLTGLDIIEFDVGGAEENALFDPAYFAEIEAFEDWLADQPKVVFTASMAETFKRLNQHMNDGAPEAHTLPTNPDLYAQYLLVYELALPFGRTLTDAVTVDRSRSRVTATMRGASTKEVAALREAGEAWLRDNGVASVTGSGTGLAVMYAYLSTLNIEAMKIGTFVALILISGVLLVAFRSVKYGVISLLPNLLPIITAFGVWGLLVGTIGVTASAVSAITLGIIVDDTVHLMWRYLAAKRKGADAETAIRVMLRDVGRPMLTSTIALIVGFAVLATSGFQITSSLGALAAITVFIALVADWFLLAPLLLAIDGRSTVSKDAGLSLAPTGALAASAVATQEEQRIA
ncbi:MAG: MMPL family transporter [Pseudomonadota bacterium]